MTVDADILISRNPSNARELGRVETTPVDTVPAIVARARTAQARWGEAPAKERREVVRRFWKILARDADAWSDLLRDEIGKPRPEALLEVVSTLDALRWTALRGPRSLADERLGPSWQRWLLVPTARLSWKPFGVIGMIGTWNYPLWLNAPAIAQALLAGNALVWKPSELALLSGLRLQKAVEEAGTPEGLVPAIYGGPDVGQALIDSDIDKGHFTGGIANGRRVLAALAARGRPAVAELSGFDAAIVLSDAPRDSTLRALTWAAFVAAGQTCVAVKRVYVVGDASPWAAGLADLARSIRVGDPTGNVDVGPLISEAARDRFLSTVRAAVDAGARLLRGGVTQPGPGWFVEPTVLLADDPAPEDALAGVFGPVVIVRGMPSVDAAVAAVNRSEYGLSASVWGRDRRLARSIAARLEVGMAAVNDAVAPSAHASAPFGGVKSSGFGRTRGPLGLREFVQPRVISERGAGGLRPQLFPYSERLQTLLSVYRRLFHARRSR